MVDNNISNSIFNVFLNNYENPYFLSNLREVQISLCLLIMQNLPTLAFKLLYYSNKFMTMLTNNSNSVTRRYT